MAGTRKRKAPRIACCCVVESAEMKQAKTGNGSKIEERTAVEQERQNLATARRRSKIAAQDIDRHVKEADHHRRNELADQDFVGAQGDTTSWSNVPSSRSRAMESAVTMRPMSSAMLAIRFGTMNH